MYLVTFHHRLVPLKRTCWVQAMCAWAVLTITGIQDLHCCCGRKLHHSHHWLHQQNLEGLGLFILPISQYPNPPRGSGLSWVKLDLPLRLALEILVLLCTTIHGANAWWTATDVKETTRRLGQMSVEKQMMKWRQKQRNRSWRGDRQETDTARKTDWIFTPVNAEQKLVWKRALQLFFFPDHLQTLRNVWNEFVIEAFT